MIGLLVDPDPMTQASFRLGLGSCSPDLELQVADQVPAAGDYDLCLFRTPQNAFEVRDLVRRLRTVCKPGAVLFAYGSRPSSEVLHALLRAGCRCGADVERVAELRWLWSEVRDEVQLKLAAERDPGFLRAASSIRELLSQWRACLTQAELAG